MGVDNEAARAALVKPSTAAPALRALVKKVLDLDAKHPNFRWVLRVPSSSNEADAPSRRDLSKLLGQKALRRTFRWRSLGLG